MALTAPLTPEVLLFLLAARSNDQDQDLILRIRAGDEHAFRTFFDKHHDALKRYLLSRGISRPEADDLVQQAFLIVWEKRGELDPNRSVRALLFRIAYTRMLNHIRDTSRTSADPMDQEPEGEEGQHDPLADLQHGELVDAVENALEQMPEKRRAVFELCFLQQFTYKEAADALDIAPKTVENHMGYALKSMRKRLKNFRTD